jgi:hypothetical protein
MLQAHSILWHYLWVAPNVFLLILAMVLWQRGLHQQYLAFFLFAIWGGLAQLTLYAADVIPSVSPDTFWHVLWSGLLIEAILKFAVIGELFSGIFGPYPSLAKLGKILIRGVGVTLVLAAALAAAFSPVSNSHPLVWGPHLLEQTIYIIESGLLLFFFLFSAYFRLRTDRIALGICVGLAISSCTHLATWAVAANNSSRAISVRLDFLNMATYHACVLIWFYYLLVPQKVASKSAVPIPEHNLEIWNRELERFLQP